MGGERVGESCVIIIGESDALSRTSLDARGGNVRLRSGVAGRVCEWAAMLSSEEATWL